MTANELKHHLAAVFDDNLHTRKWHNVVDYLIIAMILLSTLEIFLSTFDLHPAIRRVLLYIDIATLIFFTIEVSLRIWVAPLVNPAYSGWKGRLRYCFSFHGFIDVVSTYPFYLQWLIPFPVGWLKVLRMSRTVRLFRISRYMKSWRLLTGAIYEKRRELLISMQFLIIITFILSLILFYCEHDRQPEAYNNGFASVIWAFAQYIGDPGGFAETPPISVPGKVIACIVGLLGIAIVAVPAGILGAGFTEAIEKENHKEALAQNRARLLKAFERKLDRPTAMQIVPFFRTLADIQSRFHLTCDEMIEAVESTPGFRLINLAATVPTDRMPHDRLAIEHYHQNRSYGQMIDRGAAVTIVSPSSCIDPTVGIFSYYIALIGGFNYISREVGEYAPYRSFYTVRQPLEEGQPDYNADLEALMDRPGAWSFTILAASGANEPEYPTQFHFGIGGDKGDESFDITPPMVADKQKYIEFFNGFSARLKEKFDLGADTGRYHSTSSSLLWPRQLHLPADSSNVIVRIAWSTMLWDARRIRIAAFIADEINSTILGREVPASPDLRNKTFGFTGYPT